MDNFQNDLVFGLDDVCNDSLTLEGSGTCRYLFIVPNGSYTGENSNQLKAICKAIHIDPDVDIQVVQPGISRMIRFREINTVADHLFFLGVSPEAAGISFTCPKNQFIMIHRIFILATDDLSTLQKNIDAKKGLWASLKQHFIDEKRHVI